VIASALPYPAIAKTPCDSYYKVKEGDSSSKIAHTFDLKWKEIALANNIKDPSKLKVGLVLCIPPKAYTRNHIRYCIGSGFDQNRLHEKLFYVKSEMARRVRWLG
jgi:LysM repeat protein